jgi:hypothetical protein
MAEITSYNAEQIQLTLQHQNQSLNLTIYSNAPSNGFNNIRYREGIQRILRQAPLLFPLLQPLDEQLNSGSLRLCFAHQHTLMEHERHVVTTDNQRLTSLFESRTAPTSSLNCYQGNTRLWRIRPALRLYWVRDVLPVATGEHGIGPSFYSNLVMPLTKNTLDQVLVEQQAAHRLMRNQYQGAQQ